MTITPFNVIQGHRFWYQSKALPLSDYIIQGLIMLLLLVLFACWNKYTTTTTNLPPILHRFQVMAIIGQIFVSDGGASL